jgi:hypothetical protein
MGLLKLTPLSSPGVNAWATEKVIQNVARLEKKVAGVQNQPMTE